LLSEHRIFTVARDGPARGACVRATPGVFTTMEEVAALQAAIRTLAA
jgi:selenocysteine lyase/cysteine desulfurase